MTGRGEKNILKVNIKNKKSYHTDILTSWQNDKTTLDVFSSKPNKYL